MLALPEASLYLKTELMKRMTGRQPHADEKVVLLMLRENLEREELTEESFYPIGVTGVITEVNNLNGYFVIRTRYRINLDEVHMYEDHSYDVSLSRRRDEEDLVPEEEEARLLRLKEALLKFAGSMGARGISRSYIAQLASVSEIACAMARAGRVVKWAAGPSGETGLSLGCAPALSGILA